MEGMTLREAIDEWNKKLNEPRAFRLTYPLLEAIHVLLRAAEESEKNAEDAEKWRKFKDTHPSLASEWKSLQEDAEKWREVLDMAEEDGDIYECTFDIGKLIVASRRDKAQEGMRGLTPEEMKIYKETRHLPHGEQIVAQEGNK